MKTSLDKHYKDRSPKETIQIIQTFFEQNNYQIKIEDSIKGASSTFSYHIELYTKDNILCLESNGKGVDANYALASAYAELYERFCNKNRIYGTPLFTSILQSYNYKNYHYNLAPDEKEFNNFNELFPDKNFQKYFNIYFNNDFNYLEKFYNLICNKKYIGLPYKNIFNEEIKYYNPILLLHLQNTNGMSAGNTLEEAINHGISEIIERWCINLIDKNVNEKYYALNLNTLKNKKLKEIIQQIEKDNNTIYILDLSYSFGFPVMAGIIFNHKSKNIAVRLGSFPVFDIALERVLTELYQGISSWGSSENTQHLQRPYKTCKIGDFADQLGTTGIQHIFPEPLLDNITYVDTFNSEVFLSNKEYSNKEILNYYKDFCLKKQIDVYMRDVSLSKDVYAIHIYSPQLLFTTYNNIDFIKQIPIEVKRESLDLFIQIQKNFIKDKELTLQTLSYLPLSIPTIQMFQLFSREHIIFLPFIELDDFEQRIIITDQIFNIYQMHFNDEEIMQLFNDTILQTEINKYLTINRYMKLNYSYKDIEKLFEQFGDNITKQYCLNINNPHYIINQIFVESFNKYYNINNILHILNGYFKEDVCDTQEL